MLKFKTTTEFTVPTDRGTKQSIVRLIIDGLSMDKNNIIPSGYYYYYDENENIVTKKINALKLWSDVQLAETQLAPLASNTSLYDCILQRLKEFTNLQFQMESGVNFGTNAPDWVIDTE